MSRRVQSLSRVVILKTIFLTSLFCPGFLWGDPETHQDPPEKTPSREETVAANVSVTPLDEMVVTATRTLRDPYDIPRGINVVTDLEIQEEMPISIVDTLDDKIGVWVEKRTTTASDPVIRGFSGRNLLALIDGNTLSTLWGEGGNAGDDMYAKIDPDSVDRIEVVRGPASVLYGSNALGGVINFFSRSSPFDYTEGGYRLGARTKFTYGSAARAYMLRQDVYGATKNVRFTIGGAWRDIDDVEAGRGVGLQVPTSGEAFNWDGKFQGRIAPNHELTVSVQDVQLEHTHRFYRPTQDNFSDREGISLFYDAFSVLQCFDALHFQAYYQRKKDRRRFFDKGWEGIALTKTFSTDLQASTLIGNAHKLTYGLHYQLDDGENPDDEQFTYTDSTGRKWKDAPDSVWQDLGVFIQDEWEVRSWLSMIGSFRYDLFVFDADPDPLYQPPGGLDPEVDSIHDTKNAYTGGLGLVFHVGHHWNLFANYSRGFRMNAPNFGIRQVGYGILVPNKSLEPITADDFEAGVKLRYPFLRSTILGYYTMLDNFQTILPGSFLGQDWYDWNENGERDPGEDVYVTRGNGDAYVTGVELEGVVTIGELLPKIGQGWSFGFGFMWNYGQDIDNDQPLRHTHPIRGIIRLRWDDPNPDHRGLWFEFMGDFVGEFSRIPEDRIENDPGYREDPQDMTSPILAPLPGYQVFDLRGGCNLTKKLGVSLAVENITDAKYRRAHSRWDEVGINFLAQLTATF